MGRKITYKCNKCDYSALISCGVDRGFTVKTNTMLCEKCKKIVDVVTEYWTDVKLDEDIIDKCPECNSGKYLKQWDNKKRPCPKCNGVLEEGNGVSMLWD